MFPIMDETRWEVRYYMEKRILLSSPTTHGDELKYIDEAFARNWVAPLGFNCDAFEDEMRAYLCEDLDMNRFHALALSSCTASLHLAVKLAGIGPGDVVLCSDMTFVASVNPVCYEGGIPVFVDSERDTWNMDPAALEKAFERYPQAKAVMLVHLYGTPAKLDEIISICQKHNAILIEDAAEALASTYKGRRCGTFGQYNGISFNGNKLITTSGGGMLITGDKKARDKALFLATQARENFPWYQHEEIGYNYRMSNVVAGIGRGQLIHIEDHRSRKEAIYFTYKDALRDLPITMNPYLEESHPNFWLSCMTINEGCNVDPMHIIQVLAENNVEARPIWKPMHQQPLFQACDFVSAEEQPVNEEIFARGLCLPSDIKMTKEEQRYVIDLIRSCF